MPLSKSALAAVFRRSGSSGDHTGLYDDASSETKKRVDGLLRDHGVSGEPVIVTSFSSDDLSVITTGEVFVRHAGTSRTVPASEVVAVEPARADREHRVLKTEWDTLEITLPDGAKVAIRTDRGGAFSGVWNVLKTFEAQSSRIGSNG